MHSGRIPTTQGPVARLRVAARRRYLDVLASIYIYNEHRGYSSIDRVLAALHLGYPDAHRFIAEVEKHRQDERKHYVMFCRYFDLIGRRPFQVDETCGHIDRLIRLTFGCGIDDLDTAEVVRDPELFERLCRVIMLTEQRGMRQVEHLLRSPAVRSDRRLIRIFQIIERDEPSHWMPYRRWIAERDGRMPSLGERLADGFVHRSLVLVKLPLLYLNPWLRRRADSYDDTQDTREAAGLPV